MQNPFFTDEDVKLMITKLVDPVYASQIIFSQRYPDGMLTDEDTHEQLVKIYAEVLLSEN